MNLFVEIHKLIMTDQNAMAFAKLMNSPLKQVADVLASQFEQLIGVLAVNIHNSDQLKNAVQMYVIQTLATTPIVIFRTFFKSK